MWFIVEEQKNYMDQIDYGSNFEHICNISKNNQSLKFIVMNDFYKTIIIIEMFLSLLSYKHYIWNIWHFQNPNIEFKG